MLQVIRTTIGILWLFSLGAAVFFLVFAPFEIKKTRDAWSWQPVKVRVVKSHIEHVRGEGGGHSLQIGVQEVDNPARRGTARVRFGHINHGLYIFSRRFLSTLDADQTRYPVGKELVAYRQPDADYYVLEQNSITLLATVWITCLVWLIINWRWLKWLDKTHEPRV
jgi:hypothetical protein